MKELIPRRSSLVAKLSEQVSPAEFYSTAVPPQMWKHLRTPITFGLGLILVFVVGGLAWAFMSPISGAVVAPGYVRVDQNRKVVKHRDGGIVREIFVREGEAVTAGQVLMQLDETTPRASVEVLRGAYEAALVQKARFVAERDEAPNLINPPELANFGDDAAIQSLVRDQAGLFMARKTAFARQIDVLTSRIEQLRTRIVGTRAQMGAVAQQKKYIDDELEGVAQLYDKALVTKTRMLVLRRTASELEGTRGAQVAEISRTEQAIGEAELEIAKLKQQRASEASEGLRDVQTRLFDTIPRLRAAEETLALTKVRAPATGYVLNLTQFTDGGVIAPGEQLMDIVPMDRPLVFEARLKPDEAYEVTAGMNARVQLATFESRQLPPIPATVTKVAADRLQDQKTGEAYFTTEVAIDKEAFDHLTKTVKIYPGMSATVMIGTGERTVMDYMMGPVRDSMRQALKER